MSTVSAPVHSRRRHWLCVAYAFPPINRSGTHRTLGFVKHLTRFGWDATVLTVDPRDDPLDESLSCEIPVGVDVLRTAWEDPIELAKRIVFSSSPSPRHRDNARLGRDDSRCAAFTTRRSTFSRRHGGFLRQWLSQLMHTPDSRIGWIGPAVRTGRRVLAERRFDLVYSSSPYMSAHLIALRLARRARLPWVADFRDPWRGNPFREPMCWPADGLDALLESLVLRRATRVVCCTPTMTDALRRRVPFVRGKCHTILNGIDREYFKEIRPIRLAPPDCFVLAHCGQFYGPRSPIVWFGALRRALNGRPQLTGKLRLLLIGPDHYDGRPLSAWAAEAHVGDSVTIVKQQPHAKSLRYLAGSDALVLAGAAGPGAELQVPNKLFEYLALRKPIIAACAPNSPMIRILREARAEALTCAPHDEHVLAEAVVQLATQRRLNISGAWSGVDQFDRQHRAAELAQVFEAVAGQSALRYKPERGHRSLRVLTGAEDDRTLVAETA